MQTLKCIGCGKVVNGSGTSFYCEGCSGYYCYNCGMQNPKSEGSSKYLCPNCSTELQQVNM